MIGSGEAESRAVASAIRGAVAASRLDAGVNIASLLVDLDVAVDADCRQLFMCWHLTRVLGPSLTEMVQPPVVRGVVRHGQRATTAPCLDERPAESPATTPMQFNGASSEEFSLAEARAVMVDASMVNDGGSSSPQATSHQSDHVLCSSGHLTCWCPEDARAAPRDDTGRRTSA